ncbi:tripartite tricarboxylate transporter substrate binding protein [uncultured Clostridium sp.]|uniref:tripartite tricarboxylate transporter substrate binding protein n=1 Tax=uncultured Clostridium sp. TaxID=59620 RepID=UPI0028E416F1|nr:tripartite tricarboxylate transporter substrate binding protein [uncultured Clostridium sp.]
MKRSKVMLALGLVGSMMFMTACGGGGKTNKKEGAKYPTKQINMIIQAAPGGLSDTVARTVASELQKELGVPVVSTNKTGAAGAVAMSFLQGSNPDGYTIGYVPVELAMVKALGYSNDVEPDGFTLLGRSNISPATVTVRADAPWKTIEEFLDYAKKNPGKVKVGNSGTGSIWHIAAATVESATNTKFNHVPFDGAAPAIAALMGSHIDAVTVSVSEVKSGVEGGQLRVLSVVDENKSPFFPEVPTMKEKGYDTVVAAWGGFAAPKDLPQEVKDVLVPAIEKAIQSESLKKIADERAFTVAYQNGEEFNEFAKSQFDFYMRQIPAMGIKK